MRRRNYFFASCTDGFTLFEVILVLAIVAFLAASSVPFYGALQKFSVIDSGKTGLEHEIRLSQKKSLFGKNNLGYGIYLEANRYVSYQGNSYATREPVYDHEVFFDSIHLGFNGFALTGVGVDIHFALSTGLPNNTGIIIFYRFSQKESILAINSFGVLGEVNPGTITLAPDRDSYIFQGSSGSNYGSGTQIQVYPWSGWHRRGILYFDFSGIPKGAHIDSAYLYLKEVATYGPSRTINLHHLNRAWKESEVSWSKATSLSSWAVAGGDFDATPVASTQTINYPSSGTFRWDQWNIKNEVEAMVSETKNNDGWILRDSIEDSSQAYWYFSSKEGADDPYVVVNYSF